MSSSRYSRGEIIYINLTNVGERPLELGSWRIEKRVNDRWEPIYTGPRPSIVIVVMPGESRMEMWTQRDSKGVPVGLGIYRVVWEPTLISTGERISCSATFEIY